MVIRQLLIRGIMMKHKLTRLLLLGAFFITTAGLVYFTDLPANLFKTEEVKIQEDSDGIWRIRDKDGSNKGTMHINKKDKIAWLAHGSDVEFRFHKNVHDYFIFDEGLFEDGNTQMISNNKKLRVTLKENAPADTLIYDVYVVEADTFVVGNSPPKLIIR